MREFVIYDSICHPKSSEICKICLDYRRYENERYRRGEKMNTGKDILQGGALTRNRNSVRRNTDNFFNPQSCS